MEIPKKTATQCRLRWIHVLQKESHEQKQKQKQTEKQHVEQQQCVNKLQGDHFKKVLLSPFEGSLGMNVQALPSKSGIGVVCVASTSPLYRKIDRGDIIVQFMEKPLHDIGVEEFIDMVTKKKDEHTCFIICSTCRHQPANEQQKGLQSATTDLPEINLDENDTRSKTKTFTVAVQDIMDYDNSEMKEMPICFAFDPKNVESEKIASARQKRCHSRLVDNSNKKQKISN